MGGVAVSMHASKRHPPRPAPHLPRHRPGRRQEGRPQGAQAAEDRRVRGERPLQRHERRAQAGRLRHGATAASWTSSSASSRCATRSRSPSGSNLDPRTVPLAELLLTKLQVVRTNRKDVIDICAILLDHDVGETDGETVNAAYIASLLSGDWGLWRTSRGTIETTRAELPSLGLEHGRARPDRRPADGAVGSHRGAAEVLPLEEPGEARRSQPLVRGARGDRAPHAGRGVDDTRPGHRRQRVHRRVGRPRSGQPRHRRDRPRHRDPTRAGWRW